MKKILYIDMDNVLVDFPSAIPRIPSRYLMSHKDNMDEVPGIFSYMDPIPGAINSFNELAELFDTYILSTNENQSEIIKRLYSVNWSIGMMFLETIGAPRGQKVWELEQYAGNFVFAIMSIILPLTGIVCAMLLFSSKGIIKFISSILLFVPILIILITDGSRTPAVMVLGVILSILVSKSDGFFVKIFVISLGIIAIFYVSSLMAQFRGDGFQLLSSGKEFVYHQDDSYYRALNAMYIADNFTERWSAIKYFTTILVNPIPRMFWADKPLLDEAFYLNYKLFWVTISYFGESAALFGVIGGFAFSTFIGFLLYLLLKLSSKILTSPFGIVAYFLIAIYCYQIVRSLQNITNYVYVVIAALILVSLISRFEAKTKKRNFMVVQ